MKEEGAALEFRGVREDMDLQEAEDREEQGSSGREEPGEGRQGSRTPA